jgi:hypothetical protein
VGGLAVLFAGTAFGFLFHYGNTRAIHLHIQIGNAWPQRDGQRELECSLQLALLTNFDVLSDGFGGALHGFGGYRQTCQQLLLLAALLERSLMTDSSHHLSYARRELRDLYVQFDVDGKLAAMTLVTQVIRTQDCGRAHRGQHRFRA